jgi:hypothetical protein
VPDACTYGSRVDASTILLRELTQQTCSNSASIFTSPTLRRRIQELLRNIFVRRAAQNGSAAILKMLSLLQMRCELPCGNAVGFLSPRLQVRAHG